MVKPEEKHKNRRLTYEHRLEWSATSLALCRRGPNANLFPSSQTTKIPQNKYATALSLSAHMHQSDILISTPSNSFTCSYVTKAIAIDGTT